MRPAARIPVLVVSGFLGSGKTSLLRHVLTGAVDTAVIVNEFGAVGLDHELLRDCQERVELVGGGCACCSKREDLVLVLRELLSLRDRGSAQLDRVVIETSGLADPAPIVFTITNDPMLRHHFEIERLIVTVDALHGSGQLATHPEVAKQVLVADDLVITKVDLVDPEAGKAIAVQLASLNPAASIHLAVHGLVDDAPLKVAAKHSAHAADGPSPPAPRSAAGHTDDVRSLRLGAHGSVDWLAFAVWLSMLLHAHGEQILRVKGLLKLDDGTLVSVNGVQHVVHMPEHLRQSTLAEPSPNIVFIMRGLEPDHLQASFERFQSLAPVGSSRHAP